MLYRINYKNFLMYAIDYFTRDELASIYYIIISAKVQNNGMNDHITKINELYPTIEIVTEYDSVQDMDILEKAYREMLGDDNHIEAGIPTSETWAEHALYRIIHPVIHSRPVVLICSDESHEDDYVTCLCKLLKRKYSLDVIDLNQLFTEGHVGPYHIDLNKIHNKTVPIARAITTQEFKDKSSTKDGRVEIIHNMSMKHKLKMLKQFDIRLSDDDKPNIDTILLDAWCEQDGIE